MEQEQCYHYHWKHALSASLRNSGCLDDENNRKDERMEDWRNTQDLRLKEIGSCFCLKNEKEELYLNTNYLFIRLMAIY